jgi:hypothetical protein
MTPESLCTYPRIFVYIPPNLCVHRPPNLCVHTPESLCTYPRIFVYIDPRIFVYINAHFYDFFKIQKVPETRINTNFFDVLPIRRKPRFYSIAKNPIYLYISLYQQARRRLMLPGVADKMKSARQQQPFLYWHIPNQTGKISAIFASYKKAKSDLGLSDWQALIFFESSRMALELLAVLSVTDAILVCPVK